METMKVSKQDAAAEQIDQAICCLFNGFVISAVTLAGAAETSLLDDPISDGVLFPLMKSKGAKQTNLTQKTLADEHFNKLRNWLKHDNANLPEANVRREDGVIMILRTYTKFTSVFGKRAVTMPMKAFESWFRENYQHWLQPEG